jgi:hypothetical protein
MTASQHTPLGQRRQPRLGWRVALASGATAPFDPRERNNEPLTGPRDSVTRGAQRSTGVAAGEHRNAD